VAILKKNSRSRLRRSNTGALGIREAAVRRGHHKRVAGALAEPPPPFVVAPTVPATAHTRCADFDVGDPISAGGGTDPPGYLPAGGIAALIPEVVLPPSPTRRCQTGAGSCTFVRIEVHVVEPLDRPRSCIRRSR